MTVDMTGSRSGTADARAAEVNDLCGSSISLLPWQWRPEQGRSYGDLGIDIGGSGIKGALVDITSGTFLAERYRLKTPSPATLLS
jgi:hypothetical protein